MCVCVPAGGKREVFCCFQGDVALEKEEVERKEVEVEVIFEKKMKNEKKKSSRLARNGIPLSTLPFPPSRARATFFLRDPGPRETQCAPERGARGGKASTFPFRKVPRLFFFFFFFFLLASRCLSGVIFPTETKREKTKREKENSANRANSRAACVLNNFDKERERDAMKLAARQRSLVVAPVGAAPNSSSPPPPPRSSFFLPRRRRHRCHPVANSAAAPPPAPPHRAAPPPPPPPHPGPPEDPEAHARNAAAIAFYVRRFLDEEWRLELDDHARLGSAAAEAYRRAVFAAAEAETVAAPAPAPAPPASSCSDSPRRLDVGDVLLAVASDLSARPELFAETFTDAFETANKVAELLVHGLSGGKTECGCVSESSVALMDEAFAFADDGEKEKEETS